MKTEITKSDLYGMTIAKAQAIANKHKEDPNWDFWNCNDLLSSTEADHEADDQNHD